MYNMLDNIRYHVVFARHLCKNHRVHTDTITENLYIVWMYSIKKLCFITLCEFRFYFLPTLAVHFVLDLCIFCFVVPYLPHLTFTHWYVAIPIACVGDGVVDTSSDGWVGHEAFPCTAVDHDPSHLKVGFHLCHSSWSSGV